MADHKHGCCADKACTDATCMELPAGKTCGDCKHFRHCAALYAHKTTGTYCDFFPRRFREPVPAAPGVGEVPALVSIEVLRQHWLRAMECDHATGQDKPHCSCSQVDLGWHPSIGAAVEAWLTHVAGVDLPVGGKTE